MLLEIWHLLSGIPSAHWSDLSGQLPGETSVWRSQTRYGRSKCGLHTSKSTKKKRTKWFGLFVVFFPANGISGLERVSTGMFAHVHPMMKWLQVCEWRRAWCLTVDGRRVWGVGGEMTSCQTHGCRFSGGGPLWMAKRVSYINHAASFHCDNHVCHSGILKKKTKQTILLKNNCLAGSNRLLVIDVSLVHAFGGSGVASQVEQVGSSRRKCLKCI